MILFPSSMYTHRPTFPDRRNILKNGTFFRNVFRALVNMCFRFDACLPTRHFSQVVDFFSYFQTVVECDSLFASV